MGKGGQQVSSAVTAKRPPVWESPYKPLSKNAPQLPTKGEIKAAIPAECFERSYVWSTFYLFRDLVIAGGFAYLTSQVLSTDMPVFPSWNFALWALGWSFYAFWMGTILTGPWVLAHECGHGAFSPSQAYNDFVGFILHQALLVPYFSWQYSHAKHHRRTNHLTDGESHVPSDGEEDMMGLNKQRVTAIYEAIGDDAFAAFQVWSHLVPGWPVYLLGFASTGKLAHDGTPLNGRIMDHFRPNSPMFPPKMSQKVLASTVTVISLLVGLCYLKFVYGFLPVFLWYWGPYFFVNGWLVLYTWLQHTDPSIPHYGETEWTWVKGALSTIDRDYGIFDFFHHRIGSTHVVHHLFHEMPWYNAAKATAAAKAFLEPKGLYNYDPTPWWKAMWHIAQTCHFVNGSEGIQYFHSYREAARASKKLN